MQIPEDAVLLRIFIGESDRWEHRPLYEAIVLAAREAHLAYLAGHGDRVIARLAFNIVEIEMKARVIAGQEKAR